VSWGHDNVPASNVDTSRGSLHTPFSAEFLFSLPLPLTHHSPPSSLLPHQRTYAPTPALQVELVTVTDPRIDRRVSVGDVVVVVTQGIELGFGVAHEGRNLLARAFDKFFPRRANHHLLFYPLTILSPPPHLQRIAQKDHSIGFPLSTTDSTRCHPGCAARITHVLSAFPAFYITSSVKITSPLSHLPTDRAASISNHLHQHYTAVRSRTFYKNIKNF